MFARDSVRKWSTSCSLNSRLQIAAVVLRIFHNGSVSPTAHRATSRELAHFSKVTLAKFLLSRNSALRAAPTLTLFIPKIFITVNDDRMKRDLMPRALCRSCPRSGPGDPHRRALRFRLPLRYYVGCLALSSSQIRAVVPHSNTNEWRSTRSSRRQPWGEEEKELQAAGGPSDEKRSRQGLQIRWSRSRARKSLPSRPSP